MKSKQYYKVWFTNGSERTAQVVVDTESHPLKQTSISDYSRLFPCSEAGKMKRICFTGLYDSSGEAFLERSKAMGMLIHPANSVCPKHADATAECTCWKLK